MRCCILIGTIGNHEPQLTDEELINQFLSGNNDAFEKIVSRYLGLISSTANQYRSMSADIDNNDMIQEGMVALLDACRNFNGDKGASFKNYLMHCVKNCYRSMMRSSTRKKVVPSHNIISIEEEQDAAFDSTATSLPELVETKEYISNLYQILRDSLSDLEYKVAILHLSGYSRKEISNRLNISLKSVDNAQTRIRQKLSGNTPRQRNQTVRLRRGVKYIPKSEVHAMYEDKILRCKDCGNEFVFTAGEQEFYAEKGFVNEPQRCKDCRVARKNAIRANREMHTTVCADCGGEANIPFKPMEGKDYYCSECFAKRKEAEEAAQADE